MKKNENDDGKLGRNTYYHAQVRNDKKNENNENWREKTTRELDELYASFFNQIGFKDSPLKSKLMESSKEYDFDEIEKNRNIFPDEINISDESVRKEDEGEYNGEEPKIEEEEIKRKEDTDEEDKKIEEEEYENEEEEEELLDDGMEEKSFHINKKTGATKTVRGRGRNGEEENEDLNLSFSDRENIDQIISSMKVIGEEDEEDDFLMRNSSVRTTATLNIVTPPELKFSNQWKKEFDAVMKVFNRSGLKNDRTKKRLMELKTMKMNVESRVKTLSIIELALKTEIETYNKKLRSIQEYGASLNYSGEVLGKIKKLIG